MESWIFWKRELPRYKYAFKESKKESSLLCTIKMIRSCQSNECNFILIGERLNGFRSRPTSFLQEKAAWERFPHLSRSCSMPHSLADIFNSWKHLDAQSIFERSSWKTYGKLSHTIANVYSHLKYDTIIVICWVLRDCDQRGGNRYKRMMVKKIISYLIFAN